MTFFPRREPPSALKLAGIACAAAGTVYLIGPDRISLAPQAALGNALIVAGMMCQAIYFIGSRGVIDRYSSLTVSAYVMASAIGGVLPAGVDAGTLKVTVSHDDVQVWTTRGVARRGDDALYLGTDKTIYQPGQDVHLRLLALTGPDRLPVADADVIFEARDGRGNKVFRRSGRTDSFGVAAVVVPTDTRVNEGDWRFSADVGGRQTMVTDFAVRDRNIAACPAELAPPMTYTSWSPQSAATDEVAP